MSGYHKLLLDDTRDDLKQKRLIFLKSYLKIISVYTQRHKSALSLKENEIKTVIFNNLNHLEQITKTQEEFNVLLMEMLHLLDIKSISHCSLKCFETWMTNKLGNGFVIKGLLGNLGISISNNVAISVLLENALGIYFCNNGNL